MNKILTILTLLIAQNCFAQNIIVYRPAMNLKIPVDGLNYYEERVPSKPYFVKDKKLQIYPGEKLFIEVEIKKDTIFSMNVVKANLFPERTITINFSQKANGNKSESMTFKMTNPFKKTLECKALIYKVGQKGWKTVTINPILPNSVGSETWKDVVITMVIDKWKLNTVKERSFY